MGEDEGDGRSCLHLHAPAAPAPCYRCFGSSVYLSLAVMLKVWVLEELRQTVCSNHPLVDTAENFCDDFKKYEKHHVKSREGFEDITFSPVISGKDIVKT